MIRKNYTRGETIANSAAIEFYQNKLEHAPSNPRYNNFQAILHQAKGDEKAAETFYLQTIASEPHNVMARNDYALHLSRNMRYSDSVDEFKKAMLITEDQPTLRKNVAAVLSRTGQYSVAMEHAMRAVQLNPNDSMNHRNVAKIYEAMGNGRDSLHHNLQSVQLEQASGQSAHHTRAYRSAAVQIVAKGGDVSLAHQLMDAARRHERKKYELPTTERTYEIIERINKRKGDMESELAAIAKKEAEKKDKLVAYKSGVMARFEKLKGHQEQHTADGVA